MSETAAPPAKKSLLRKVGRWAAYAVYMVVGLAAWDYLKDGREPIDVGVIPGAGWLTVMAGACIWVGILLLNTKLFDLIPRHGPLSVSYDAGLAWTHSIAFRLAFMLFGLGALALVAACAGMAFQAGLLADWGRLAIGVVFTILAAATVAMIGCLVFLRIPVLGFDPEGLENDDHRLEWSEIDKIGVKRRLSERRVELFLVAGHPLGPTYRFSLKEVGLTAGEFLDKIEALAPQVRIERPAN
jgi:hypothetical protein